MNKNCTNVEIVFECDIKDIFKNPKFDQLLECAKGGSKVSDFIFPAHISNEGKLLLVSLSAEITVPKKGMEHADCMFIVNKKPDSSIDFKKGALYLKNTMQFDDNKEYWFLGNLVEETKLVGTIEEKNIAVPSHGWVHSCD